MRIMHVMGGGDVGGAKTQIMNTVTGLNRNNDVMLISFRAGPFADEARERGIDVRVIERHNPFRAARTMRDLVDAFKPDIIHCHGGRATPIYSTYHYVNNLVIFLSNILLFPWVLFEYDKSVY